MSILVWRQMDAYYALGTDGLHRYTVTRLIQGSGEKYCAWHCPSTQRPGELLEAFEDEASAKRACQRDLDERGKAKASASLQMSAHDQHNVMTRENSACS